MVENLSVSGSKILYNTDFSVYLASLVCTSAETLYSGTTHLHRRKFSVLKQSEHIPKLIPE